MKEITHTRKGKQIIDLSTGAVEDFSSINQAKKHSRALQKDVAVNLRRLTRR